MDDNLETLPVVSVQTQRTYWMTDTGKHGDIKAQENSEAIKYFTRVTHHLHYHLLGQQAIRGMQQSTFLFKSTGLNEHDRMIAY